MSGENFMNLRKALGLTQREVANALGITDQAVSNWERGVYEPRLTLRQTAALCGLYGKTVQELAEIFGGNDE